MASDPRQAKLMRFFGQQQQQQQGPASPIESGLSAGEAAAAAAVPVTSPRPSQEAAAPDAVLRPPQDYQPVADACWEAGTPTPYLHVARALAAVNSTSKRLVMTDILTNAFRSVLALAPADLLAVTYLVLGKLGPDHEGLEMQVGGSTVSAAIAETTGASKARLSELYVELGDLGDVASSELCMDPATSRSEPAVDDFQAQACRRNQRLLSQPRPLLARDVFASMRAMATEDKGQGSAARRRARVAAMLRACREEETRFLVRTLICNLRVGAQWRGVLSALGRAIRIHEAAPGGRLPDKADLDAAGRALVDAYHLLPNLDELLPLAMEHGIARLPELAGLRPGTPVKPMLARICEGIGSGVDMMRGRPFLAEFKYDGQRAQVHVLDRSAGRAKVFSRNSEDKTGMFPDLIEQVLAALDPAVESAILDTEVVAVDRGSGDGDERRLRSFQELSTRARGDTTADNVSVNVCVFAFDLLLLNGRSLVREALASRRDLMTGQALTRLRPGFVEIAESRALQQQQQLEGEEEEGGGSGALEEDLTRLLMSSLAAGTEGLMLKDLTAAYEPSKRSDHWVKAGSSPCPPVKALCLSSTCQTLPSRLPF